MAANETKRVNEWKRDGEIQWEGDCAQPNGDSMRIIICSVLGQHCWLWHGQHDAFKNNRKMLLLFVSFFQAFLPPFQSVVQKPLFRYLRLTALNECRKQNISNILFPDSHILWRHTWTLIPYLTHFFSLRTKYYYQVFSTETYHIEFR